MSPRAKKALHLVGSVDTRVGDGDVFLKAPKSDSLLAQLWPVVESRYLEVLQSRDTPAAMEPAGEAAAQPRLIRRLSDGWILPPPPEGVCWRPEPLDELEETGVTDIEYEWAGEAIRHIGTVVHRGIQRIAEEGLERWDDAAIRAHREFYRLSLKRLGIPDGGTDMDEALATVEQALINLIHDERAYWLLDPRHAQAWNEYPVSGLHRGRLVNVVLDRTFVDDQGVRWIVDYKTSRHKGGSVEAFLDRERERYREQLEKYAALVRNMDGRPVSLGLYFPLLQGWREWRSEEQ